MIDRLSFGFHNPNHAAALACALLPLCFGWRRAAWVGRGVAGGLFAVLLLTQSRTGLIVAALEWAAWWTMRRGKCGFQIPDLRSRMGFRGQGAVFGDRALAWLGKLAVVVLAVGLSLWRLGPRLALDGSILNRPKIWLAGLRLFAANPDGVGLGNSGALASAFLLPGDVPEVRTLVSSHLTLLAECGWLVGWAYLAFLALALCGVRRSPRVGLAFAGLALSACSSTVFDWPVLFGCASQGGLGGTNLALSWLTLALFAVFGARLIIKPTYPPAKQPEGAARRGAFNAENEEERRRGEASTDFTDSHGLWEGASANLHESSPVSIRDNPCQFVDRNSADGVSATLNTEVAENRRHGEVATDFTDSHGLGKRGATNLRESSPIPIRDNPCQFVDKNSTGEGGGVLDRIDKIDRIEGEGTDSPNPVNPVNPVRKTPCLLFSVSSVLSAAGLAGALVLAARCVPPGDAPRVQGGCAASGAAPRTLALYDDSWSLRAVRARAGADALVPVRPVARFPRGLDLSSVNRVLLFGDCREWAYLVPKGVPVTCMED